MAKFRNSVKLLGVPGNCLGERCSFREIHLLSEDTDQKCTRNVLCLQVGPSLIQRLQPSAIFPDSQGFDRYVGGQGLPKWSSIVCQGSEPGSNYFIITRPFTCGLRVRC